MGEASQQRHEARGEPGEPRSAGSLLRDDVGAVRSELARAPGKLEERAATAVRRYPLLDNIMDVRLLLIAGVAAIVLALVVKLLASPLLAVVAFVILFFGIWLVLAARKTGD
jgi:Flp pilus assembly protein TadB